MAILIQYLQRLYTNTGRGVISILSETVPPLLFGT